MKVWVAYAGEYSSRGLIGVFSCAEKAAACYDPPSAENDIEEVELDQFYGEEMIPVTNPKLAYGALHRVRLDLESGDVIDCYESDPTFRSRDEAVIELETGSEFERPSVYVRVAKSKDLAMKLAVEARQHWLHARLTPFPEPAPEHPQTLA